MFVVLHWQGQLCRFVLRSYLFAMSVSTWELPMTIVVVSTRHGGCANGGCPEVVVVVVTACPDSLLSRWDGSAAGGGRCLDPYERG